MKTSLPWTLADITSDFPPTSPIDIHLLSGQSLIYFSCFKKIFVEMDKR
jgi:hypothetical protein